MRLAVISDIHGNMEAFTRVLNNIDASNIDTVICLGDNIGYGPEPDRVVELIRRRNIPSVMGNHELAAVDINYLNWFNPHARAALIQTIDMLSEESSQFIYNLRFYITNFDCRFVHGFPPDSPTTYLFEVSEERLSRTFKQMKEKICFIGHTHMLEIIGYDGKSVFSESLHEGRIDLHREKQYIVNIGSVGQPRDGNNNAKYVIWDSSQHHLEVRFVPYDAAAAAKKIIEAGLPERYAARLL